MAARLKQVQVEAWDETEGARRATESHPPARAPRGGRSRPRGVEKASRSGLRPSTSSRCEEADHCEPGRSAPCCAVRAFTLAPDTWRRQREAGALAALTHASAVVGSHGDAKHSVVELEREVERLRQRLLQARPSLSPKKVSLLLGSTRAVGERRQALMAGRDAGNEVGVARACQTLEWRAPPLPAVRTTAGLSSRCQRARRRRSNSPPRTR